MWRPGRVAYAGMGPSARSGERPSLFRRAADDVGGQLLHRQGGVVGEVVVRELGDLLSLGLRGIAVGCTGHVLAVLYRSGPAAPGWSGRACDTPAGAHERRA